MRYHLFPGLLKDDEAVRYRVLAGYDHELEYFRDETLIGEILESISLPWYRRIIKWPWISWEIEANDRDIGYYFWATDSFTGEKVKKKIAGEYPKLEISKADSAQIFPWDGEVYATTLKLERDYPVKIKTFINDIVDSQSPFVNSLSGLENGERAMIQILLQPARNYQNNFDKAMRIIKKWDEYKDLKKIELFENSVYSKQTKALAHCYIRIIVSTKNSEKSKALLGNIGNSFAQFSSEALNRFVVRDHWLHFKPLLLKDWQKRRFPIFERNLKRVILNIEELSGIVRFPSRSVINNRLKRNEMKNIQPPAEMIEIAREAEISQEKHFVPIGQNKYRDLVSRIYMNLNHLKTHALVAGGSGSGKSVFLQNLMDDIVQLKLYIRRNQGKSNIGFTLIDPHGELSKLLISNVPEEIIDEIKYIRPDANDKQWFPFNVFDVDFDSTPDSVSKNVADVLKRIWPDGWGVRPDRNMLHAGIALQYCNEASLINVNRLYSDYAYCQTIADQIADVPHLKEVHASLSEMAEMMNPDAKNKAQLARQHRELTDSTRNKLEQFSLSTLLRDATGAKTCGIRWRTWMDEGKIVVLDLSKIKNEQEKKMYGSMSWTMSYQAALTREELISKGQKPDIYFIIADELPSFLSTDASVVTDMADRTRYVSVPLIGAAQGLVSQLPKEAAQAILRNFSTIISYRVSNDDDAEEFAKYFNHEQLTAADIKRASENHAYMRISVGRSSSKVFSATMDPPRNSNIDVDRIEKVLKYTRDEALERENAAIELQSKKEEINSISFDSTVIDLAKSDENKEQMSEKSFPSETIRTDHEEEIIDIDQSENTILNNGEEEISSLIGSKALETEENADDVKNDSPSIVPEIEDSKDDLSNKSPEIFEEMKVEFSLSSENEKGEEENPWESLKEMAQDG
ncbi:helicase HerA domain-containing protein [Bacillus subtilis]|uniref:helicase HerA domain-containing protein n=1 Tax=Bacillus subtilis group TaxID=653685 RepID=UPI0011A47706|nr:MULTISPECIES: DUF87 domain-containing protein [Bacillus subtilis group]CAF1782810.1 hypothetical protein NRS6116_03910 [Bacillus subtilis]CAF1786272.1 hypothetical protein NRS6110_04223 [Bacillus subtilis]CAI6331386.1 ATP-binding protein [Bacillus subtilis]